VGVILLGILVYVIYINSHTPYDFTHLTQTFDFGQATEFTPLGGTEVPDKVQVADSGTHALYICPYLTTIAVIDRRNGQIWYGSPPGTAPVAITGEAVIPTGNIAADTRANPFERNVMNSNLGFRFYDQRRRRHNRWVHRDAVVHEGQARLYSIPNGVRVIYDVGDTSLGYNAIPEFMGEERWYERIIAPIEERQAAAYAAGRIEGENVYDTYEYWRRHLRFLQRQFLPARNEMEGFIQRTGGVVNSVINTNHALYLFYEVLGYTFDELEMDNVIANVELEIDFDYFSVIMDFVLDGDTLKVRVPLDEIYARNEYALIFHFDLMRFMGAAGMDETGYLFVPSGSGALIEFNNGRFREEPFMSSVYGLDQLMNDIRPQIMQPIRMPVFGIIREGAAMLAEVYSGSSMALVNADVAGRTNSFNYAWFSFSTRSSIALSMAAIPGADSDMTLVQPEWYTGDILVKYHFLATEGDMTIGPLAQRYQQVLVERGVLTPLPGGPGDRTFYLDVVGAIDMERHFLGTPYMSLEVMTSLADANRFVDLLNAGGVNTIQMQLHGWFNRGINHDVAKRVRRINGVGSQREFQELDARLREHGGALNPAVNFQMTNFYSRRFNSTFESAKDPAGFIGFMSRLQRDTITTRMSGGTGNRNDWFILVNPGVLPFHIDRFIPAYERALGIEGLALLDLGDIVSESMYRRDPVDREHSRLIVMEQMERLEAEFPNLVVFGGNDYALRFASHVVDAPIVADMFYIINHEVPFYQMVLHGFIEYAGSAINLRETYDERRVLLNMMATGAAPRFTMTQQPTRVAQFSPHERLYSTLYSAWMDEAIESYRIFNDVYRYLRTERMVDFIILADGTLDFEGASQVTATVFSDGTRIYVNNTRQNFPEDFRGVESSMSVEAMSFEVVWGNR
jgi:hypothetical protein